ncbi:aldehyde dehydrogenase family protein [Bacillus solitudinis]|uniref:aldehyde dehydrogenase family protein n=1 Tax=Bacillus solitudinis TaxID=2014074 RepID=UPI000C24B161|nr:aldehyde dehydrogenase family protein [Bacillus solitudinis]
MSKQIVKESMLIGGSWEERGKTISVYNPGTGEIIATVPAASVEDVYLAIARAKEGAKISAKLPIHERMRILHNAANWIEGNHELYAKTISQEGSKTIREARKEVNRCVETLRLSAEEARRIEGETIPFSQMQGHERRIGYVYRFPIGVVAAITPFNDPLNLVAHKIGPAIASGNAVIVKPATLTPLSAIRLAEAFEHAGLPDKILSVITGFGHEICDPLVEHKDVRLISFTGGYETGKSIIKKAGVKKVAMELGSNTPAIILNDANVELAVQSTVAGAFGVAGQNCLSVQRIYVQEQIYPMFLKKFVEQSSHLKLGNKSLETTDIGPMISTKEAERVEQWIKEATLEGAEILTGGNRIGTFIEPTVLIRVPKTSKIANEEVFGPVVMIEPIKTLSEGIESANNVQYGLQAGIFTSNLDSAFEAIGQLEVGGVIVNDCDVRIDAMPFGGVKRSGLGREGVRFAIEEMTEQKVVAIQLSNNS